MKEIGDLITFIESGKKYMVMSSILFKNKGNFVLTVSADKHEKDSKEELAKMFFCEGEGEEEMAGEYYGEDRDEIYNQLFNAIMNYKQTKTIEE